MIPVYISHATPHTVRQSEFIRDIKDCFSKCNIVCDNVYVTDKRALLHTIRDNIKSCYGIVIVAYERKHIISGMNKRGANIPGIIPERILDISETTPFVHIEMSMAFAYDLPVIVFKENGLLSDGVLDESCSEIDKITFDMNDMFFFDTLEKNATVLSFVEKVRLKANER